MNPQRMSQTSKAAWRLEHDLRAGSAARLARSDCCRHETQRPTDSECGGKGQSPVTLFEIRGRSSWHGLALCLDSEAGHIGVG